MPGPIPADRRSAISAPGSSVLLTDRAAMSTSMGTTTSYKKNGIITLAVAHYPGRKYIFQVKHSKRACYDGEESGSSIGGPDSCCQMEDIQLKTETKQRLFLRSAQSIASHRAQTVERTMAISD